MPGRFRRLKETMRPVVRIEVDGEPVDALEGDTLIVAVLASGRSLRVSEFGDGPRAGFCLMGACHDCMVWTPEGEKLRACSTPVENGMKILTRMPEVAWPPLLS